MRVVLQRVSSASVSIEGKVVSKIGKGLLILLGVGKDDSSEDIEWLVKKISQLRIFSDEDGRMNLSIHDIEGEAIVVSQFTLYASTKKGNRPSYIRSAVPDMAIPLYEEFVGSLRQNVEHVGTGEFGANMQIELVNDGPVTIVMDSKNRE
jgi:D-tyrosyl-tRNA(Tyr) deacylase